MSSIEKSGTYTLGTRTVKRLGYGAMQLAGPGVFGPPKDKNAALAVLREAVASGVDHIDTSDFYGPHITNQLIREALHPYRDNLTIVTKIGARRGDDASWLPAFSAQELTQAVHDNLRNLKLDVLDVVNLRIMFSTHGPAEGSITEPLTTLAELQQQGLIRHIGLSNVTAAQVAEAQKMVSVVCVQNMYNIVNRGDDALVDALARQDRLGAVLPAGRFYATAIFRSSGGCGFAGGNGDAGSAGLVAATFTEYSADSGDLFRGAFAAKPGGGGSGVAGRGTRHAECAGGVSAKKPEATFGLFSFRHTLHYCVCSAEASARRFFR
jgi:diketogulonate reductase-like aldo/keto reductase